MTPDSELLRQFARTRSEAAFAELVQRHVNLVYSAALRQVNGDAHLAQDVAQTVFSDLARKAALLARGRDASSPLTSWLYTAAHHAAAKMVRGENRRRDREETFMREPENSGMGVPPVQSANEMEWEKLRPTLDDAMHELKETDREAILLRYFENQPFIQVGAKLGLNENAARMRVDRALDKLRDIFAKRGITTATALASVISANAIQIAPANLAATLTTTSIAAAGTGTFTFLKIMTATKLKLGISALVVAGATTAFVVQQQTQTKLRGENESLQQQIAGLQTDNENYSNRLTTIDDSKKLSDDQFNELLKLRGEVGVLRNQAGELGKLREENQQLQKQVSAGQNQTSQISPEDQFQLREFHTIDAMKQLGLAMRIYAGDHGGQYATNFNQLMGELGTTNFSGGVTTGDFEFMNVGLVNETMPNMIIFREREPRENPYNNDGVWSRIYGLADGSAQTIYGNSANAESFNIFEQQHSPPPNPSQ